MLFGCAQGGINWPIEGLPCKRDPVYHRFKFWKKVQDQNVNLIISRERVSFFFFYKRPT
uniref:Uncharacterized protein n=1 Tax=Anguilla anguilla TaxID=7936 RepID=A0A0E9RME7_ANGAN